MRIHQDWETAAFDAAATAPDTGPFPRRSLLHAWWDHRGDAGDGDLCLVESDGTLLPLLSGPSGYEFLGEEDLVDYHSPLGPAVTELTAELFAGEAGAAGFRFDSLPCEAAEAIAKGLAKAGIFVEPVEHTSAAVLDLPGDFDEYLQAIGQKQRHELRRKRRRFESLRGPAVIETTRDPAALADFVRLHRLADGEKGDFMSDDMAGFFARLLDTAGADIDLLRDGDGGVVGAVFGFRVDGSYYLYNSAYDPGASAASPGAVLLGMLIESAVADGMAHFDFLKGDEQYKYRLGARKRPLFEVGSAP